MKDKVVSMLRIVTGILLMLYVGYLFSINAVITQDWYSNINMFILWLIGVFGIRILITGVRPFFIPRPRLVHFFTWIVLIVLWSYMLKDTPSQNIFLADILNILWAFLVISWPIWLLVNEKIRKQKAEEKIEIIEV